MMLLFAQSVDRNYQFQALTKKSKSSYSFDGETNGFAIAGFVCSFFIPLLGWIFGGIGLNRANSTYGKGKGLSIAAIIIASAMFVFNMVFIFTR